MAQLNAWGCLSSVSRKSCPGSPVKRESLELALSSRASGVKRVIWRLQSLRTTGLVVRATGLMVRATGFVVRGGKTELS